MLILISLSWDFLCLRTVIWTVQNIFTGSRFIFTNSSVRNVDFRSVKAIIEAEGCDFRGMKYDEETQFVYGGGELAARSRFMNCQLDDEARKFLMRQGVEIISYDKHLKL